MARDFGKQLRMQLKFLKNDLEMFKDDEEYAIRIALLIRVLVHDKGRSISLITHLGIKEDIKYYDSTSRPDAFSHFNIHGAIIQSDYEKFIENTPYTGLVAKDIKNEGNKTLMRYKPIFHHSRKIRDDKFTNFSTWWEGTIYDNKNDITLTRKDLILNAAEKDGGAHEDKSLEPEYISIRNQNYIELIINGSKRTFSNVPSYSSIAQIGWELLTSLKMREDI